MKEARDAVVKVVEKVTIAELCERANKLKHEPFSALDFVI
jgi:hypothetical protein